MSNTVLLPLFYMKMKKKKENNIPPVIFKALLADSIKFQFHINHTLRYLILFVN